MSTFSVTEAEAIEFGNYLIKGDVIEQLTNRFNNNFTPKSNYLYCIQEKQNHRLFWLDELRSTLASLTRSEEGVRHSSEELVNAKAIFSVSLPASFKKSKSMQLGNILKYVGKEICPKYDTGLFSMKISDRRCIIVFAPELNQIVLENAKNFVKLPEHQSSSLSVDVLRLRCDTFTPAQLKLKAHYNTIILQRFTKERVYEKFLPIMIEKMSLETDELLAQFKSEKPTNNAIIDIPEFFNRTVLRILSEIFVGTDLVDHPKWSKVARYLSGNSSSKGKIKAISQMKQKNRQKYVLKALDEILQERQAERRGFSKAPKRAVEEDILEILLNTSTILDPLNPSDEIPAALSNEVIIHTILSVLSHTHFSIVSMLSWLVNYLYDYTLGNSDLQQLLSLEIDKLSGNEPLYFPLGDISKSVPILNGMLKETLRLYTPVPGIIRQCVETTNIGEYVARKGIVVIVSTVGTHYHPKYWEEHQRFNPFRFSSQAKQPIEAYSYIPWSGGSHRCSAGFEFSLVIGRVLMTMLLTRFELRIVSHANVFVKEGEEIPNFPNGLQVNAVSRVPVRVKPRGGSTDFLKQSPEAGIKKTDSQRAWSGLRAMIQQKEYQLIVAAGTRERTGTTATTAAWFCEKASEFHFRLGKSPYSPDEILPLLQSSEKTDFMILGICIATYQGKPAPNARQFVQWLEDTQNQIQYSSSLRNRLKHINFFVFGCGDSTWSNNYQKIAQIVDEALADLGANRICPRGQFDSSIDDLHESYSMYYKSLAPRLMHSLPEIGSRKLRDVDSSALMGSVSIEPQSTSSTLQMEFVGDLSDSGIDLPTTLPTALTNEGIHQCRIIKISTKASTLPDLKLSSSGNSRALPSLQEPISESSLHRSVELQIEVLPELEYAPGDSILIYPKIGKNVLYPFFSLFTDYDADMVVKWTNANKTTRNFHLPLNRTLTLENIFSSLVDLTALPTRQFLMNISTIVKDSAHVAVLNRYASDISKYQQWIKANPGIRLLDVITAYPVKSSALDRLIEFLPVLQPRAYPICSNWKYHTSYISILISDTLAHNPTLSYILQLNQEKQNSPTIHVALRRGESLSLETITKNTCRPVVAITRGLSIAPFISLLFDAVAEGLEIRTVIYHCMTPADSKKKFILRRSIRRLQKAGVLEDCHLFFVPQAVTIINNAHNVLWEFINNFNCKLYIAGWNGASLSEIMETLIRIIQTNCTPLVYRGCKDYANAYLKQLREAERLEECWY